MSLPPAPSQGPPFFFGIFRALLEADVRFVVVGGQACNLWAEVYEEACPALTQYRPYTSLDVDLYSESQHEVTKAARRFRVEAIRNEPGSPAPVMGLVNVELAGTPILVQFLSGAYGIRNARQIVASRQELEVDQGLRLPVVHPVLLLQSKLAMVAGLPRGADKLEQDRKHLRMAVLFTGAFILERAQADPREAINLCKRVCQLAQSTDGLAVFQRFGIQIEGAVLPEALQALKLPKLDAYLERAYPDALGRIEQKRARTPIDHLPEQAAGLQAGTQAMSDQHPVWVYETHLRRRLAEKFPHPSPTQQQRLEAKIKESVQKYAQKIAREKPTPAAPIQHRHARRPSQEREIDPGR